ncbi:hypothetical protein ACF1AB_05170 [Streptomyces sp. NPDC014846]|uniref:hypothetical protein n=1 Tax=unclassified Streptomyces TaxID=2593676 RepID=UPI0037031949
MTSKITTRSSVSRLPVRALLAALLGMAALLGVAPGPAQAAASGGTVHIWGSQVRVRQCASTTCGLASSERLTNVSVYAYCQRWGDRVTDGPYYNHYWVEIVTPQGWLGWVSAVYVSGGSNDGPVPGVPTETDSSPVHCEYP